MTTTLPAGDVLAKTGEAAKAGPIGLVVIVLLCIACYFLFKSMSKHLRRVREDFPSEAPSARGGQVANADTGDQPSAVPGGEQPDAGRDGPA